MTDKLPDKIIGIDQLKINRGINKFCTCHNRRFMIDPKNRRVTCQGCGSGVDPYDAMYEIARKGEKLQEQVQSLLEQRKQIQNYKPWLVTIKNLEKQYRGKKMLPTCPSCEEPFYLEELTYWTNAKLAEGRIQKRREKDE